MASEKFLWPLVFVILTGLGGVLLEGGYVHYEGQFFLVNFLDSRDFFGKIFSAHHNEWDCYQGRELSFLFGWLDSRAIVHAARVGLPHLYSTTHFILMPATAILLWRVLPRLVNPLPRNEAGLVVTLLLTSPVAALSGYYYRPAKILAAFVLAVVVGILTKILSPGEMRQPRRLFLLLTVAATLLGLSDRLGIYSILLIGIIILSTQPWTRRSLRVILCLGAALATNAVWSVGIGPRLAARADGYPPNVSDQIIRVRHALGTPDHYIHALRLLRDHLDQFFGNFGPWPLAAFSAAAIVILLRQPSRRLSAAFAICLAATIALYATMYARLPSLVWPASVRVYYWLPQLILLAGAAAIIVSGWRRVFPRLSSAPSWIMGLMIGGNLLALPGHRVATMSQEHRSWIEQSSTLRECIGEIETSVASLAMSPEYRQVCSSVRLAAYGTAGPGGPSPRVEPNPLLTCRRVPKPGRRSSIDDAFTSL